MWPNSIWAQHLYLQPHHSHHHWWYYQWCHKPAHWYSQHMLWIMLHWWDQLCNHGYHGWCALHCMSLHWLSCGQCGVVLEWGRGELARLLSPPLAADQCLEHHVEISPRSGFTPLISNSDKIRYHNLTTKKNIFQREFMVTIKTWFSSFVTVSLNILNTELMVDRLHMRPGSELLFLSLTRYPLDNDQSPVSVTGPVNDHI